MIFWSTETIWYSNQPTVRPSRKKEHEYIRTYLTAAYSDLVRHAERQGKDPSADVVAGLRRAAVARYRGRHRLPAAPERRLAALPRLDAAPLQHHRGDHRAQIQQVRTAPQLGDVCLRRSTSLQCRSTWRRSKSSRSETRRSSRLFVEPMYTRYAQTDLETRINFYKTNKEKLTVFFRFLVLLFCVRNISPCPLYCFVTPITKDTPSVWIVDGWHVHSAIGVLPYCFSSSRFLSVWLFFRLVCAIFFLISLSARQQRRGRQNKTAPWLPVSIFIFFSLVSWPGGPS